MPALRKRGWITGLLVGVVGGALWLTVIFAEGGTRAKREIFIRDPRPQVPGEEVQRVDAIFVVITGPLLGVLLSILLSSALERWVLPRVRTPSPVVVFGVSAGAYLLVVILLAILARTVEWAALSGLDFATPLALISWALLGGLFHALRRPAHRA